MMKTSPFVGIASGTLLVLMIPYLLMTFKVPVYDPGSGYEVINWTLFDFIAMGGLIFGTSSMFVVAARILPKANRLALGIVFTLLFLWLWAELAVGVFTNWGS